MVTLNQLKKENQRLKKMEDKLAQIRKDNEDRKILLRENKRLARDIKFGKSIKVGRKVGNVVAGVGKASGRGLLTVGKGALKGLQSYGRFLREQESKQRSINRKLKTTKKRVIKKSKRRGKR